MMGGKELDIAKKTLNELVDEARKAGDQQVFRFDFSPSNGSLRFGADYHPSIWQHQLMASELTSYLRNLMQWF